MKCDCVFTLNGEERCVRGCEKCGGTGITGSLRFGVTEGPELTPIEALEAGFLQLAEQYKAMGEQLKFLAHTISAIKRGEK